MPCARLHTPRGSPPQYGIGRVPPEANPSRGASDGSILQAVPNVPTLYALVRSSPVFYTTYISGQRSILLAVLSTELTPTVLRGIYAGGRAAHIRRGDDGSEDDAWTMEVNTFLDDYRQYGDSRKAGNVQLLDLILNQATLLHISHNHTSVRTVTLDFCKSTLSLHPITGQDTSSSNSRKTRNATYVGHAIDLSYSAISSAVSCMSLLGYLSGVSTLVLE